MSEAEEPAIGFYAPVRRSLTEPILMAGAPRAVAIINGTLAAAVGLGRGPDLESATAAELVSTTSRLNGALRRLGSGWAVFVEAQRIPANRYPRSTFPDPASALVENGAPRAVRGSGRALREPYFLTLCWLPPADAADRAEGWLYEGRRPPRPEISCSPCSRSNSRTSPPRSRRKAWRRAST